ncbi:Pseudouridine synthase [Komagataella phaffii CBS 7435]|uniref:Pseudouridine synthase n=2 Tax=Komagataella phaffii TaxID=460519 RepID=C4R6H0_KOMPG|nr:Pseudouridine synthase [Komagataella phaffii GS115]AOA64167.1 GQ67_04228T0 [Komagataella phaffii]CAH2449000.1 Pseudouridine synthase [Komagataella phaffii CBS 7435]AOA69421.1 GQ68_04200T0 [Komagataella phaffii GS115]CAY71156.1 Pseudouridine synthase [Komagataella phaffii GS115]CCA39044.1 Pseudouridine synthase [Komagataella phaffii CBS 7435]
MSSLKENRKFTEENASNKRPKLEPQTSLKEKYRLSGIKEPDVGITEYITKDDTGFTGILKHRYTDFLVNEIDTDGNVIYLENVGFEPKKRPPREANSCKKQDVTPCTIKLSEEHRIKLESYFGEEDVKKLLALLVTGDNLVSQRTFDDKEQRTKIHKLLREAFYGKLETITSENNRFKIALLTKGSRRSKADSVIVEHSLGKPTEFLHVTMLKENKETMEVASTLSRLLKIPVKWISYAGTKDRRGVTVQRLSLEKMRVERVSHLNKVLRGVKLGSFAYATQPLKLGQLNGNSFLITIKDVKYSGVLEKILENRLQTLDSSGFVNYFGMQRFGTFSVPTHIVGIQLLQSNWKGAVELLLSEQELVMQDSIESRKIWKQTHDASLALKTMPSKCNAEYAILKKLSNERKKDGNYTSGSYFNAIMQIPRNLRIMYGHAYQSFIWNSVASKRIELFGLNVVEGDLVLLTQDETDEDLKHQANDQFSDENDEGETEDIKKSEYVQAKVVTKQEIESKKYSIFDVVLPTPGFDVIYPSNEILRQVYIDLMAKDGLDPFLMSRRVREFSYAGTYRRLLGTVNGLEYYVRHYSDNNESLVRTDLELLKLSGTLNQAEGTHPLLEAKRIVEDKPGDKIAIIVKMQLDVASYATMALRELMRTETSRRGDTHEEE